LGWPRRLPSAACSSCAGSFTAEPRKTNDTAEVRSAKDRTVFVVRSTTLPNGSPRVEPTMNEDRCTQRDLDALKSPRGERMMFKDAGESACSRQVEAKDRPAWNLISCLVQPCACNPEAKKAAQTKGRSQHVPSVTTKKKIKN